MWRDVSVLLCAVWMTGCATMGTFQTASTLGKGGYELGGDLSALTIVSEGDVFPIPVARLVGRYGVTDAVDVGASIGNDGLRGSGRIRLTQPESKVIVSVVPGVRWTEVPGSARLLGFEQQMLLGLPAKRHEVVLSARATQELGWGNDGGPPVLLPWLGAGAGASLGVCRQVFLMPEVGIGVPLGNGFSDNPTMVVQGGLGLLFKRR